MLASQSSGLFLAENAGPGQFKHLTGDEPTGDKASTGQEVKKNGITAHKPAHHNFHCQPHNFIGQHHLALEETVLLESRSVPDTK